MPTTSEYLSDLVEQKNALADNINNNGVSASQDETLNTLVPKVNDVYTKGVEDGAKSEYDKFWDNFQNYGKRSNYSYAFCGYSSGTDSVWTNGFTPKYPIVVSGGASQTTSYMFAYFLKSKPVDFVEFLNSNKIIITQPYETSLKNHIPAEIYTFYYARGITRLPKIQLGTNMPQYTFYYCSNLVTIDELYITNGNNQIRYIFGGCGNLENVNFTGVMQRNGLDLSPCPKITHKSIMSLFNILYDYSGTTTTRTLTLGNTNLGKITEEEKAIAINKGWTLS